MRGFGEMFPVIISRTELGESVVRTAYTNEKQWEEVNILWGYGSFHGNGIDFFEFCEQCTAERQRRGDPCVVYGFSRPAKSDFDPCIVCKSRWLSELEYPPATRMTVGARCGFELIFFAFLSMVGNWCGHWWEWHGFLAKIFGYSSYIETFPGGSRVQLGGNEYTWVVIVMQLLLLYRIYSDCRNTKISRYFLLQRKTIGKYSIIETPIWEHVFMIIPNIVVIYTGFAWEMPDREVFTVICPLVWGVQIYFLSYLHLREWKRARAMELDLELDKALELEFRNVVPVDEVDAEEKGVGAKPAGGLRED